ncbi:hypothetical protein LP416_27720 [Polaromonas sp. P2-4]|nr:hypothetical protein LP416_27720 [Polaromonas sp. P2-4]
MIFRVTHTDLQNHRRKAHVTARNVDDCIAQIETELGEHIGLSVCRMKARPVLHLRPTEEHLSGKAGHA